LRIRNMATIYAATRILSISGNGGFTRLKGIAHYDARHQENIDGVFKGTSYRASFGISFSSGRHPSGIPLIACAC